MSLPPSFRRLTLAIAGVVVLSSAAASHADFRDCEQAISSATVKLARTQYTLLRKCNDAVVKGIRPGPCPDLRTMVKLANAATKLRVTIDGACGGGDGQCGGSGDVPLASVGWNVGTCPNIEGGSCTNAIADCGDVADCVTCVVTAAVNQAVDVTYGDLDLSVRTPDVVACQRAIGKFTEKFFGKQVRALQKCGARVILGFATGPCPDPITVAAIQKAEAKKVRAICKFCGGPDRLCGGGDDLSPATVGFGPSCPDVTVPRGAACAAPITDMQSIVACADCIAEFKGDCVAAIAVPDVLGYPDECKPGATATPTPAATATGVATASRTATPTPLQTATRTATPTVAPTPTLPLPTSTLIPTVTLPLPTVTLPLPTLTPTPAPTPVCGNGIIEAGEQCELLAGGCTGLQLCLLCQCIL